MLPPPTGSLRFHTSKNFCLTCRKQARLFVCKKFYFAKKFRKNVFTRNKCESIAKLIIGMSVAFDVLVMSHFLVTFFMSHFFIPLVTFPCHTFYIIL